MGAFSISSSPAHRYFAKRHDDFGLDEIDLPMQPIGARGHLFGRGCAVAGALVGRVALLNRDGLYKNFVANGRFVSGGLFTHGVQIGAWISAAFLVNRVLPHAHHLSPLPRKQNSRLSHARRHYTQSRYQSKFQFELP